MTYSVIARCARTGQLGIAIASYSIAVGRYCDGGARANTGITITQGFPLPRNNTLAVSLLAQGHTAGHALEELKANDAEHEHRQIAIVDREGNAVAHTGAKVRPWSGQRIGVGYAALGDMLAGQKVVDALAAGFEAEPHAELDARLLAALERGRDAGGLAGGGGRLPERSVALIVWGIHAYSDTDLRVDLNDHAIAELRRVYVEYKPYGAYYDERAKNPRAALPQFEFADLLNAKK